MTGYKCYEAGVGAVGNFRYLCDMMSFLQIKPGLLSVVIVAVVLVACGGKDKTAGDTAEVNHAVCDLDLLVRDVSRYWDDFDFSDTTWLSLPQQEVEGLFLQWAEGALFAYYECDTALSGALIRRAAVNPQMLVRFMEMGEKCFRDPNSPWRCEELYIPMLEAALKADAGEAYNRRYREHLRLAMMNRQGTVANDFTYINDARQKGALYEIDAEYLLLYFFNPGCHDCGRVSGIIANSQPVNRLIEQGRLVVVALYPDEDMAAWNEHRGENPKSWITARYACEEDREKYDLPAIPNLYLLGRDKTVLLKDATVEEIIGYLESPSSIMLP